MIKFQITRGKKLVLTIWLASILLFVAQFTSYSQNPDNNTTYKASETEEYEVFEPFTIILLIDISPSAKYKITEIQDAAYAFVDALSGQHKIIVVQFDQNTNVLTEPTSDKDKLYDSIKKIGFGDGTSLYDTVDFVFEKLLRDVKSRSAIVLFSDGVDTTSRKADYDRTVIKAEKSDTLIFPVYYNTYEDWIAQFQLSNRQHQVHLGNNSPIVLGSDSMRMVEQPAVVDTIVSGTYVSQQSDKYVKQMRDDYLLGRKYIENLAAYSLGRVVYPESGKTGLKESFADIAEILNRLAFIPLVSDGPVLENNYTNDEPSVCETKSGLKIGELKKRSEPDYPDSVKKSGIGGRVRVVLSTDEKGKVTDAVAFSGHPALRTASEQAALKMKFKPTKLCGKPIEFTQYAIFPITASEEDLNDTGKIRKQANESMVKALNLIGKRTYQNFQLALTELEKSNKLYEQIEDNFGRAMAYENIGIIYFNLGKISESIEFYDRSLSLYKSVDVRLEQAMVLINLGLANFSLGNYQNSLNSYKAALPILQGLRQEKLEAKTLRNIGLLYAMLRNPQKSMTYYDRAMEIQTNRIINYPFYTSDEDRLEEARTLYLIGSTYYEMGDRQKALDYFHKALPIFIIIEDKINEAAVLNNLGTVYFNQGKGNKALHYYRQALQINNEIGDRVNEAIAINNIGSIYAYLGNYHKALEHYNHALLIQKIIGDKLNLATALSNLMWIWKLSPNPQMAIFYGKQSVNQFQEIRQNIQRLDENTQKTYLTKVEHIYRRLADLLIAEGRFAQAEQVLRMLKEEEHFDFVRRDASEIKNLNQRVVLSAKERELVSKYSELAESIAQIGQEYEKISDKKRELSRKNLKLSASEQKRFEELSAQLESANTAFKLFLEKVLVEELGKTKAREIEYDRNLQAKLRKWGDGTVALYTVLGEDRYRVIMTTPTVQIDGKYEIKRGVLNKMIFAFRDALQNPRVDPRPLGKELYDILINPIERELEQAGAKTLVWSLDGTLRYIPLAALSPDGQGYLVEKYQNAVITPKTRDDVSVSDTNWQALGLGVSEEYTVAIPDDPDKKISFTPLPAVKKELMAIVRDELSENETGVLTGKRFLDQNFTIDNFTDSLLKETPEGEKKFTVVHIASHFRLGSNWSNSFLLLGNGTILTLEKVSTSPNIQFGEVDLITLSACNTAFADESNGKEVDSLAEAIQERGGKAVLATLWNVADESTQLLMTEFYRLKKVNPQMTKAEALQKAQQAMIAGKLGSEGETGKRDVGVLKIGTNRTLPEYEIDQNAPFAHPNYWSPFVLIGNWR